MKSVKFFVFLIVTLVLSVSCGGDDNEMEVDLCEGISCMNEGTCVEGVCECPPGTSGTNCEIIDPCFEVDCLNGADCEAGVCICPSGYSGDQCQNYTPVAVRLLSETPLEIVESGMSQDSLYGRFYAGGYIFFIDTEDIMEGKEGLVCAENNIQETLIWGCDEIDTDVINVSENPLYPETTVGARPGDGIMNTSQITNMSCASGSAAEACSGFVESGFDDCFLPSRGGLLLVYFNLEAKGHDINFSNSSFWSSTEVNWTTAWSVNFSAGSPQPITKTSLIRARPVRAY